jgi:hypothetical protein
MVDLVWNRRHDSFNLLVLPIIISANLLCIFAGDAYGSAQYWAFLSYMVVDTLWLVALPSTVPSPVLIVVHHVVCLVGWNIPRFSDGRYQNWLSLGLLVEINTWFLTARRNVSHTSVVLDGCFYLTWVLFRVILYPVVLVLFLGDFLTECETQGSVFHVGLVLLCLMLLINGMNTKWTYDLVKKVMSKRADQQLARGL